MKNKWEFKQQAENKEILDLYIYGDIESDYYDWWYGEVESETSANHFKNELAQYTGIKQINLYVNTYGGSVYEAMAIRNQLARHEAKVVGIVDGFAASAGSFILTGCDVVKMYSNTMQMIHDMWMPACGNAKELRKAADDLDKIMEGNRKAYLEKSNGKISEEKLIELLEAETWLTAEECLEYGLCDEIIDSTVDLNKAKEMMQKINKSFEQQIKYNQLLQKMIHTPVEITKTIKPNPIQENIVDESKQKTNYERLRQKFIKKSEESK